LVHNKEVLVVFIPGVKKKFKMYPVQGMSEFAFVLFFVVVDIVVVVVVVFLEQ